MWRKLIWYSVILLLAVIIMPIQTGAQNPDDIHLVIEGKTVTSDVPPTIVNGRTLVPVRLITEQLGGTVTWEPETKKIYITGENIFLELQLKSTRALVNGRDVILDSPPALINNRTLLPLRFVGESLGANVAWDEATRTVIANQRISLFVNGADLKEEGKVYKINELLYAPLTKVASRLGIDMESGADLHSINIKMDEKELIVSDGMEIEGFKVKVLDSEIVVPVSFFAAVLNVDVSLSEDGRQVSIDKVTTLEGIIEKEKEVLLNIKGIKPQSFYLVDPHRVVMDFPNTVLSDQLKESSQQKTGQTFEKEIISDQETEHLQENMLESDSKMNLEASSSEGHVFVEAETSLSDEKTQEQTQNLIKEIRYSQYSMAPYTVRVVVELNQRSKYSISETEDGLSVKLDPIPLSERYLIVIDAGHGGQDPGARGLAGNYEKDLNLIVANKLIQDLQQYPEFEVVATRTEDVYLTLQERVDIANQLGAKLFLSIHANSYIPKAQGSETYYYTPQSADFARLIHKYLLKGTKLADRGLKTNRFFVIKNTTMPSALVEMGFLSNVYDNPILMTREFQERVAKSLAEGIREYYLNDE
ncbi:N-acetylmuramoyl-L-alanine amidase family protein [Microaerobacter geothermalis]|uniref:N-acetylmuramoyl-L-alanine amidase n=1 Tax=Microaerobacter geothermalis TaxID=674972 RepID=UPI001F2B3D6D|nr:N-acetylmuramoyl-L-alanine amidase [Microaerobacter geothermalis]MCF6092849.1 N-acetylmuramoyl-L-alanine amidase family protein [Microaerobacter geothermalis]